MKLIAALILSLIIVSTAKTGPNKPQTEKVLLFLESLANKDILKTESIQKILEKQILYNPIPKAQAYASHTVFIYWKQLNKIVELYKHKIDKKELKKWCQKMLKVFQKESQLRDKAHKNTQDLYKPMHFTRIPAGMYQSLNQENFNIDDDIEITETPITEYQWATIMLQLPEELEHKGTQEITIDYKTITMEPNNFMTYASLTTIEELVGKMNQNNEKYTYMLPSINEYEAFLQTNVGKQWPSKTSKLKAFKTTFATTDNDEETGTIWEFTRDASTLYTKKSEKLYSGLVFSSAYAVMGKTTLENVVRPIYYKDTTGKTLGFRLVRHKKASNAKTQRYTLQFENDLFQNDNEWRWDDSLAIPIHKDDYLRVIINHKDKYPQRIQNTLSALYTMAGKTPFATMRRMTSLTLSNSNKIQSIEPIGLLEKLEKLNLSNNTIIDSSPLRYLINLKELKLANNKIKNIEPLKNLNIKIIDLSDNQLEDISPLSSLKHLTEVRIAHNPIQSLQPLASITSLTDLYVDHDQRHQLENISLQSSLKIHLEPT